MCVLLCLVLRFSIIRVCAYNSLPVAFYVSMKKLLIIVTRKKATNVRVQRSGGFATFAFDWQTGPIYALMLDAMSIDVSCSSPNGLFFSSSKLSWLFR